MACEFTEYCSVHADALTKLPVTAKILKSIFCDLGYHKCARHMAALELGIEQVPDSLAPNQTV